MERQPRKLTREELLAGKIEPDQPVRLEAHGQDPRIKSPDDVLARYRGENIDVPVPAPASPPRSEPAAEEILRLRSELEQWRERYTGDIQKWKDYDRQIQDWKRQVQEMFETLRKEALQKRQIEEEMQRLQELITIKDNEILRLRMASQTSFFPPKPSEPA